MHRVVSDYTGGDEANSHIKVFVRARPLDDEADIPDFITRDSDNERKISIKDPDPNSKRYGEVSFQFDRVFWTDTKQDQVFDNACRQQIDHVMSGYNSCCFAYGQTGSGKTYTMFGEGSEVRGVIPRSVEYLFQCLSKKSATSEVAMVCSFLEIYNDQIRDLGKAYLALTMNTDNSNSALNEKTSDIFESLAGKRGNPYFAPAFKKTNQGLTGFLKDIQDEYNTMNYEIREDNLGNVFVKDLSLIPVSTIEDVMSLIAAGLKVRATHETKMNAFSSRSHTVFTITVLQKDKITEESVVGMLNLVDLAGSERLKKSESVGVRLKEALHINSSLTALGKVITALDPALENSHIPYRDSKLTRVLQNSLGGNSHTTVIATIHPNANYYEECLSSLQFANRCRNVRNNPRVNYVKDDEDKDRKIKKLMDELGALRSKVSQIGSGGDLMGHLKGGSNNLGGNNKMNSSYLLSLLKKLGINASLCADGTLLVNGQKFDLSAIGLGGSTGGGGEGEDDMDSKFGTGGFGSSINGNEKLHKIIKELKESNTSTVLKYKERKVLLDEQGREIQQLNIENIKMQTALRHKEFECKTLLEEKERALNELKLFLEGKYTEELQGMITHNKEMLKKSQENISRIPDVLLEYTKANARVLKDKTDFQTPLRVEFDDQLKDIDKSRIDQIAHLRNQYEFWLEEKDKALIGFVEQFNAYRTKRTEQLRMAEYEIVRLYEYIVQVEKVLDHAQKGKYEIRFKAGMKGYTIAAAGGSRRNSNYNGIASRRSSVNTNWGDGGVGVVEDDPEGGKMYGAIVVPKDSLPINPMEIGSTLVLTRKIVEKHKEREERLKKMKEDAIQKSLHYATQGGNVKKENIKDFLINKPPIIQGRPSELFQLAKQNDNVIIKEKPKDRPKTAGNLPLNNNNNNNLLNNNNNNNNNSNSNNRNGIIKSPSTSISEGFSKASITSNEQISSSPAVPIVKSGSLINIRKAGASTAPSLLQGRSIHTTTENDYHVDEEDDEDDGERPLLTSERIHKAMKQELDDLKAKNTLAQTASQKTIIYVENLEKEIERLQNILKETQSELLKSKVVNKSLQRQINPSSYDIIDTQVF